MDQEDKTIITILRIKEDMKDRLSKKKKHALLFLLSTLLCALPSLLIGTGLLIASFTEKSTDSQGEGLMGIFFGVIFTALTSRMIYQYFYEAIKLKKGTFFLFEDTLKHTDEETHHTRYGPVTEQLFYFDKFGKFSVDTELYSAASYSNVDDVFYILSFSKTKPKAVIVYNQSVYCLSAELEGRVQKEDLTNC
ncbi:MAG: hypothetical protein IJX08_08955 [Clostridia bacterium]|nr:hypothetical protein [Clostridia bacterium]